MKNKLILCIKTLRVMGCFCVLSGQQESKDLIYYSHIKKEKRNNIQVEKLLKAKVLKVVDGDTIKVRIIDYNKTLNSEEKVRFIGVDTPETVHPKKGVEYFGKESAAYTKKYLNDKIIYLGFDNTLRDKYNRLLCYCYTEEGIFINYKIIADGYGYAYLKYPFVYAKEFKKAEENARIKNLGLWKANNMGGMIIHNINKNNFSVIPLKTDTPLIIYSDAILTFSVMF